METKTTTKQTKMAKSHGNSVRKNSKDVLGKVPPVKKWFTKFKKDQEVYLTAFLKEEKGVFYVCRGLVKSVPGPNERQVFKVQIVAVADRAIGGSKVVRQAKLLGLVCTKKTKELQGILPHFMVPSNWIDKSPNDKKHET